MGRTSRSGLASLTTREWRVAELIASGLTYEEIGRQLGVAKRTVDSHAEHIRIKLGLHSRAQITAWAMRQRVVGEHLA